MPSIHALLLNLCILQTCIRKSIWHSFLVTMLVIVIKELHYTYMHVKWFDKLEITRKFVLLDLPHPAIKFSSSGFQGKNRTTTAPLVPPQAVLFIWCLCTNVWTYPFKTLELISTLHIPLLLFCLILSVRISKQYVDQTDEHSEIQYKTGRTR